MGAYRTITSSISLAVCLFWASAGLSQDTGIERSSLFAMKMGDVMEDSGLLTVHSGNFARTEAFEVVRHADGGRTLTSVITGTATPYRVEGRWSYNSNERPVSVSGKGNYDGVPADISILATPPEAAITVSYGDVNRTVPVPCNSACLIDMGPGAIAMFTMTRRASEKVGEVTRLYWIGQALTSDMVLTEGHADIHKLVTGTSSDTDVIQYAFVETLPNPETGEFYSMDFNLYVDDTHRPLAFATRGGTTGTRTGYENLITDMPPVFSEK